MLSAGPERFLAALGTRGPTSPCGLGSWGAGCRAVALGASAGCWPHLPGTEELAQVASESIREPGGPQPKHLLLVLVDRPPAVLRTVSSFIHLALLQPEAFTGA